jgi:hypothetical protein
MSDYSGNGSTGSYASSNVTLGATGLVNDGSENTAVNNNSYTQNYLASVPNNSNTALASFTFVMWFKFTGSLSTPSTATVAGMIGAGESGWQVEQAGSATQGYVRFDTPGNCCQNLIESRAHNIFDGGTYMVAVGVTSNKGFLSVNAEIYVTKSLTGTYAAPLVALYLGNTYVNGGNQAAIGTYQGAALWDVQLSQENLTSLYNAGTLPPASRKARRAK